MAISIYDPRTMGKLVERMPRVHTFIKDTFFRNVETFDTQKIDVDFKKGNRALAPFVHKKIGGVTVDNLGYETNTYEPPLVAPNKITTVDDILKRSPGESLYNGKSPNQRAVEKMQRDFTELDEMITRREEWMCCQALFTGKIPILDKDGKAKELADECMQTIFLPTLAAMRSEGCPFKGCLYFGLMMTPNGPRVIEYNCRFGDPETQVVLPLLKTDLLTIMQAVENETLADLDVEWHDGAAACIIIASGGYPGNYEKGKVMTFKDNLADNVVIYHAGSKLQDGKLVTNGGRVLGVTARANSLAQALKDAYKATDSVQFEGKYMRSDIGKKALAVLED